MTGKHCLSVVLLPIFVTIVQAQDPAGALEGQIGDKTGGAIAGATVTAKNLQTGQAQSQTTGATGFYRLAPLVVG
jgi:hypothetical protein